MATRYRLLYFYRGGEHDNPPPFSALLEAKGWQIDCVAVSETAPAYGIFAIVFCTRRFAAYDMVAASDYFLTWAACARLLCTRKGPKLAALSFNQSRRLLLTGVSGIDRILNRIWRRVSMYLVHSNAEAALFEKLHDIPHGKFIFSHWGYDLPAHKKGAKGLPQTPYVSMIGRNNRDIATFCSAIQRAGVAGVLVTASYVLERSQIEFPSSVKVLNDRPMDECLDYIEASFAHLILVLDGQRGAGHISAVTAMLLGKPQIFSDVGPLTDYLHDQVSGIAVRIGDVDGVATAIRALQEDRDFADRLGANGRAFALETLSHQAAAERTANALERLAFNPAFPNS